MILLHRARARFGESYARSPDAMAHRSICVARAMKVASLVSGYIRRHGQATTMVSLAIEIITNASIVLRGVIQRGQSGLRTAALPHSSIQHPTPRVDPAAVEFTTKLPRHQCRGQCALHPANNDSRWRF